MTRRGARPPRAAIKAGGTRTRLLWLGQAGKAEPPQAVETGPFVAAFGNLEIKIIGLVCHVALNAR